MFWFLCNGDLEEIHAFEHWWKCKCFLYNFRNVIYMAWIYHTKTGLKTILKVSINQCNVNRNYVRSLIIKSPTAMNFQSCEGISLLPYYWYISISQQRRVILIFLCFLAYYVLVASIAITFPQLTKCQSHETYETSGSSSFQSSNGISEDCAPAAMARCTDPLKVVTDNRDLGFATSMDELQEMCP